MTQSTPPGWYPDGQGGQRWWDGNQWTEHTLPPQEADRPAAPQQPAQPGPSDVTQVRPPEGDRPAAPASGPPPAAMPTQVAGAGAPQQPQQPGAYPGAPQQGGYGQQPAWQGQQGQQGQQHAGGSSGGGLNAKLIGLVGGGAAVVILLVIVLFLVLGGGGGPKSVVEDFVDADSCGDVEDLVTDDFLGGECNDDEVGTFPGGEEADVDHEIGDEEIDGDKASVDVTTTIEFDGQEEEFESTFRLVKEDGDWKIDAVE